MHDPKEIKYGMITVPKGVSPIELCDEFHFVGFWNEPEKSDYKSIGKNLRLILHLDWPILNLILLRPLRKSLISIRITF